ncbi:TIGR04104 family putative zinc finger protein [Virgibacillus kekensis]|uniref:TIGR04104 family putative zinc finger protein n=1 Tax=Virgibacillus kekensis TaxID=202261 RepID=A0ABV9DQX1_9BACI
MPTCQNCDQKWSWEQTCKKSFTLDTRMTCPYCGVKQYASLRTRKKTTLITLTTLSVTTFGNLFFGPSLVFVFILLGSIPLLVSLYPFWLELSNKEEFPMMKK